MENIPTKKTHMIWRIHDLVLDVVTVALLSAILILMSLQIITRYVFHSPLTWTEELTRNCLVWLTFSGAVIMVRDRASICIDAVVRCFPEKVQKAAWIFSNLICVVFFGILIVYGIKFAMMNMKITSLVTHFCMGYVYLVIPVCAALMLINLIRTLKEAPEWKY